MLEDYRTMEELLEVERDLCDRLDEQISDLAELYHNEIVNLKQVTSSVVHIYYGWLQTWNTQGFL